MPKRYLLLLPVFLFFVKSQATMSIDITYRALDTFKFEVTIGYIRNCSGVPYNMGTGLAKVRCMSSNSTINLTPVRTAIVPVTQTNGLSCYPPNTYGSSGYERHIFKDTVDFNSSTFSSLKQCCELRFEMAGYSRTANITTGAANSNYYNYAYLNLCLANNNSSPEFSSRYHHQTVTLSPAYLSFNVSDSIDDDSFSYHRVLPMSGFQSTISYSSSYSKEKPFKPYFGSFPSSYILPYYNPPVGIYFDSLTGDMIFNPVQNDVTVIAIQVKEWRKDSNGQYQHIGTIRRDQIFEIRGMNNFFPSVAGEGNKTKYEVCLGQTLCFKVLATDIKEPLYNIFGDTVDVTWNKAIPNATFTILNPDSLDKVAEFCWTPSDNDARTRPYYFSVNATDRQGSMGVGNRTFSIVVNTIPETKVNIDSIGCGAYVVESKPDTSKYKSPQYQWDVLYQNKKINTTDTNYFISNFSPTSTKATDTINFKQAGQYVIRHRFRNQPNPCSQFYYDTINVPLSFAIHANVDNQTLCMNEQREIKTTVSNSNGQVGYQWMLNNSNLGNASSQQFLFDQQDFEYRIQVLATDGQCADQELITINTHPNTHPNLPEMVESCDSAITLTLPQLYVGIDWNTNETDSSIVLSQSKYVVVKVTDEYNCVVYDTTDVSIHITPTVTLNDTSLCTDILVLDAGNFASFDWSNGKSTDTIHVSQSGTYSVDAIDANGCPQSKSVSITIKPIPSLDLPASIDKCCNDEILDLNVYLRTNDPKQGTWLHRERPNSITNGMLNPKFACDYTSYISYYYKDTDPGCVYYDSFEMAIHPNPELALNSGAYCQADLEFNLANDLIATTIPGSNTLDWNCVDCNGNDFNTMLDVRSSANTDQYLLIGESYYGIGSNETDIVKLSVTNTDDLGCSTTDTTQIQISKTPPTPIISSKGQWLYTSTSSSYWYFNGNLLYGDKRDSILADFAGDFTARNINDAGCASPFSQVIKKTTGINELNLDGYLIYPNPSSGEFSIQSNFDNLNSISAISVFNNLGKMVNFKSDFTENEIQVKLSASSGVYFVKLISGDKLIIKKIIVK